MAHLNKVFLIGRLTADPEFSQFKVASGEDRQCAKFRLANSRSKKNPDGTYQEDPYAIFIDVVIYGDISNVVMKYCKKGTQIHIEGYLKQETWKDKTTGDSRSKTLIVGTGVQLLGTPEAVTTPDEKPDADIPF